MQTNEQLIPNNKDKHIHMSRTVFVVFVTSFAMLIAVTVAVVAVNTLNTTTSTDSRSQAAYRDSVRNMTGGVTNPQQKADDPMERALLMMQAQMAALETEESDTEFGLLGNYDIDQLNGR